MKTVASRGEQTKAHLLDAACQVFAENGYSDATIAEICERAGANIAAVNYHFGDKETLYVEAWRLAFHRSLERHPPDGGVGADAPPEQRLRGRVLSLLERFLDPESYEFQMVHKELANPTGLLGGVMRDAIGRMRRAMADIVRDLLGEAATERHVQLCQMSIAAQCLHPMIRERHREIFLGAGQDGPHGRDGLGPPDLGVEVLADHIVHFSLAGIAEVRRQIEAGRRAADEQGDGHAN